MTNPEPPVGHRVVGDKWARRRLVNWRAALAAYAACDPRAELDREAFLTHFHFPADPFRSHCGGEGSEKGYNGPCGADWLFWDIDRPDDLPAALCDARRLCGTILDRHRELDDNDPLIFLSGGKGLHVGIPMTWHPEPSPSFHAVARRFCLDLAEAAGVEADPSIYSKCRLFRAPNSRHAKTGLYKRRLTLDELTHLKPEAVVELARHPEWFDLPAGPVTFTSAADAWARASQAVERRVVERRGFAGRERLSAFARRFIRDAELDPTQREVSTFRVAAELGELTLAHGVETLVLALLEEPALDSGLTPGEVKHAIESGLAHARRQREEGAG
jgi:hypothetical protein